MSSSAAMSIRKLGPRVIRPVSPKLVATHPSNRSLWRYARNGHGDKTEHMSRRSDKCQRYVLYNQRKPETRRGSNATPSDTHSHWSWAAWLSQSSFSDLPAGRVRRLWGSDPGQTHKRMELLKKYIEADPYRAVFGRRLDPFQNFNKNNTSLNGFLQSFSSTEKPPNAKPRVDKWQTRSDANHVGPPHMYDPVSGRMVPIPPSTVPESSKMEAETNSHKAVDCPPGAGVEAKFAHSPSLAEDGQFQPGNMGLSPETPSSSQSTADCPPGSELDVHFTSIPPSQDAQGRAQVSHEAKRNPFVNIDYCPPGSELETLIVSESIPSTQSQSDTIKVSENTNEPNLDAGLTAGTNVKCSPRSELEANSISGPTSSSVQDSPSGLNMQPPNKKTGISTDCPPGSELEAKFSSELNSLSLESDGPVHQTNNNVATTDVQESFECSPGSEIEAQILSESASQDIAQSEAKPCVDCSPGSELETKFICNPASIEEKKSQPEVHTGLDTSKIAKNVVDCTPGNELEAKFGCEMASAEGPDENEDMSALDAIEIRSRYASLEPKVQPNPLDFDASEDRVGDFILKSQNLATEKGEQGAASQSPSPKFHILAFDASTSQVSATQADSFFGVDEDGRPSEILSRLHNPAKFLPYFEKMQEDGYEIATGGGNILVFRKTLNPPRHTLSNTATDQEPAIHAEVAKRLRHGSMDSTATCAGSPWQSTTEPPSATGSSRSEREPTTKPDSSFRKAGRRILIAGTATASTCYAVGVIVEFFRTGGNDGRGIDGFTVFESDRRCRE
ncbi:unnamed protein product [Penicillium nalgiovense]|uniref:Uncharacterized protein n=1 Tax=Penicillium nalgiovense TaxID=60175 RepID=A0A1V6Y035_PENNA|nr:hypothetical protein PENNAL_c0044G11319 [Penicillium nalgiovense]CAG7938399.1 unnamed protein product [Penicillium nalgiovense]CAG7944057.1 unnamed protein product [Penicillium nalgiovense]CAG7962315.1 unnamed protein product [Penicillium nalgiovense]CAG7968331.1 unnamed protein product [Penicillium nalgiovense]